MTTATKLTREQLADEINRLPSNMEDFAGRVWHKDICPMTGGVSWIRGDTQVWATPYWEDVEGIAVQFDITEGDPIGFTIALPKWNAGAYCESVAALLTKFVAEEPRSIKREDPAFWVTLDGETRVPFYPFPETGEFLGSYLSLLGDESSRVLLSVPMEKARPALDDQGEILGRVVEVENAERLDLKKVNAFFGSRFLPGDFPASATAAEIVEVVGRDARRERLAEERARGWEADHAPHRPLDAEAQRAQAEAEAEELDAGEPREFAPTPIGWSLWHTGGNCTAFGRLVNGGIVEQLITDSYGGSAPRSSTEPVMLGAYDHASGEILGEAWEYANLADALAAADRRDGRGA